MDTQLELFTSAKPKRNYIRKKNGRFCTMTQREADKRYRLVDRIMRENEMLRRKVDALNYLVSYYSRKSQNQK